MASLDHWSKQIGRRSLNRVNSDQVLFSVIYLHYNLLNNGLIIMQAPGQLPC